MESTLYNAVAISGTSTVKSKVLALVAKPGVQRSVGIVENTTSTATGVLKLEVNNRLDSEYAADVQAAAGADFVAKEAANTTGWVQHDLAPTATVAITAAMQNTISLPNFPFRRLRLSYTNNSNSGAINAWASTD